MIYTIVVDKQSRENPSGEQREFDIEVREELRRKGDVYDEICIKDGKAKLIRRISIGKYKVTKILDKPIETDLGEIKLQLFEGDNYIYVKDKIGNHLYAEYLVKNEFNNIYVIRAELDSAIEQTAQNISLSVNQKLEDYSTKEEMQSAIEMKADSITSSVSNTYATKGELNTAKSEIKQTTDSITSTVSKKVGNDEIISKINQSSEAVTINANKVNLSGYVTVSNLQTTGKTTINGSNITTGTIDASKATISNINANNITSGTIKGRAILGGTITGTEITGTKITGTSTIDLQTAGGSHVLKVIKNNNTSYMTYIKENIVGINNGNDHIEIGCQGVGPNIDIYRSGVESTKIRYTGITTPKLTQTSTKSKKKNIKKLNVKATKLIKNADICLYNLKGEKAKTKKHIGLVIGDGYNCPDEVISEDRQGVEQYSMTSLAWKAIQELIEENENLKQRITKLEAK